MRRLRTRLVVAAMAVALLPAVPLSVLVRDLLRRSFDAPLSAEVDRALEAALVESRDRLQAEKEELRVWFERAGRPGAGTPRDVVAYLGPGAAPPPDLSPDVAAWARDVARRRAPDETAGPERFGDALAIARVAEHGVHVLVRPLPEGMSERAGRVTETLALLRGLQSRRDQVLRGYVLPFVASYALLLGVAAAVGALLARRIARPVERLAVAAGQVGAGDLTTRVPESGSGEVADLERAFNAMVSDLERQRRELSRLERVAAWRDLARTLAHEIKNPLTPIQLAVQQLGERAPRDADPAFTETLDECVDIVNEEVESLRKLVREFSEFARLPAPQPSAGDLASLLDDLQRLYGDRLETVAASRPLPARFDAAELRRALVNLIDNGLAACAEAGREARVYVSAQAAGDRVEIRVADAGTGIAEENRDRIFEPDFSTKSGGMGLGLAIVESIVRGHGGSIGVESEVGSGTTFRLDLTGAAAPAAEEER